MQNFPVKICKQCLQVLFRRSPLDPYWGFIPEAQWGITIGSIAPQTKIHSTPTEHLLCRQCLLFLVSNDKTSAVAYYLYFRQISNGAAQK